MTMKINLPPAIASQRKAVYYYIEQCNSSLQTAIQDICLQQCGGISSDSFRAWPMEILVFALRMHTNR